MRIERKKLSECTVEDLKRIYPKNRRCWSEDGNTDCEFFDYRCPYHCDNGGERDGDCAYCELVCCKTQEDIDKVIKDFGDITVRLERGK